MWLVIRESTEVDIGTRQLSVNNQLKKKLLVFAGVWEMPVNYLFTFFAMKILPFKILHTSAQ